MSLDQIRYFVAVAEQGTTRAAARTLSISQPPLTRCILALEEELGVKLFTRSSRGMSLRDEGLLFSEHTRSILTRVEEAVVAVQACLPTYADRATLEHSATRKSTQAGSDQPR